MSNDRDSGNFKPLKSSARASEKPRVRREMILDSELDWQVSRSGGPGGQNVNKTNSAVLLRWDIEQAHWLTFEEKERLRQKLANRFTKEGEILIRAEETRDQDRNRVMALDRLVNMLEAALHVPKARKKTKPSFSAKQKRIKTKKARGEIKRNRNTKNWD